MVMAQSTALEVARVPVLDDNYVWIVHDDVSGETLVIDPGDAAPVLAEADKRGWRITEVWNTHWHPDHTQGNAAVVAATGARLTGPAREAGKIAGLDATVDEGDTLTFAGHTAQVLHMPGHTQGHVVYHFADDGLLFCGDNLFAMGCGRLFEGTPAEMYANMQRFAAMPDATIAYGAHEYTMGNGRYALVAEPDNQAVKDRMIEVERLRAAGEPTLPTTIGLERATNPFMRAASVEEFAARRQAKDNFKG
jgi:hydroxyacylglutathione hydrolase